jgi:rubrerythrin
MSTANNLKDAFAGESQANRKYLAFAKKAEADGLKQIAKLFRAAADAETIHAHNHLRVMGEIKSTLENLRAAMAGEGYEFQAMYPKFVAEADAEGNKAALQSFKSAMAVEKIHHDLYGEAIHSLEGGKDLPAGAIYVCPICGNTVAGTIPDKCPICGAPKEKWVEVK